MLAFWNFFGLVELKELIEVLVGGWVGGFGGLLVDGLEEDDLGVEEEAAVMVWVVGIS